MSAVVKSADYDEAKLAREIEASKVLKFALREELEDDLELLHNMLEGETSLFEMIEAVTDLIARDDEIIAGVSERMDKLSNRKARHQKRRDTRRAMIEQAMSIAEATKINLTEATLSLRKNADKLVIKDEAKIPSKFWRAPDPVIDKAALKKALKDGPVEGAALEPAPMSLAIKR